MPDHPPATSSRQPGLREVLLVAGLVVVLVLAADALTNLLPRDVQNVVVHTPLAIAVLVLGTVLVLWRILRAPNP
jgi:hypothetical protein